LAFSNGREPETAIYFVQLAVYLKQKEQALTAIGAFARLKPPSERCPLQAWPVTIDNW